MKKIVFLCTIVLFTALSGMAQKIAYVDTEYILNSIPQYEAAKEQLDEISNTWQKEVEEKFNKVEELYKKFQADAVLLSDEMKRKRENEIINKEKEAKELQRKYFSQDGELFTKRQELIKPIQDEIFNAVKEIATDGNYAIIFDAAGGANMLFSDPKYDKSDEVLKKMGYGD